VRGKVRVDWTWDQAIAIRRLASVALAVRDGRERAVMMGAVHKLDTAMERVLCTSCKRRARRTGSSKCKECGRRGWEGK
jgi:hypothetical protein